MLKCILVFKEIRSTTEISEILMLALKHVPMYFRSKVLPGLIFLYFLADIFRPTSRSVS